MKPLIVLRPDPAATIVRARAIGLDPIAVPLFILEPIAWTIPPGEYDALLLTSAATIRLGGPGLAGLRGMMVVAVGEATAKAARMATFVVGIAGEFGVDAVLEGVEKGTRLLHPGNAERYPPSSKDHRITPVAVYRAVALPPPELAVFRDSVVLIHSPRAGQRLAELLSDRSRTTIAAISPAAARACGSGWAKVESSPTPNDEALLSLARRLCQSSPPK